MLANRPENWDKDSKLDLLWLFYQCTDEFLSNSTADTYALPLHNSITLAFEIQEVYYLLQQYNIVDSYYKNYIPPIIEELLDAIEGDYVLKQMLGDRLGRIKVGLTKAVVNQAVLERWVGVFIQACTPQKYIESYVKEINRLVVENKDKNKLIYCTKNYYVSLRNLGYTREYLYVKSKRFFNNSQCPINSASQIHDYLEFFNYDEKPYDFLILMNTEIIDYLEGISDKIQINVRIKKVNIATDLKEIRNERSVSDLIVDYEKRKHHARKHEKFEIVKYEAFSLDPYQAIKTLTERIKFLQTFKRYFFHFSSEKQVFKILLKGDDNLYSQFNTPNFLQKRPYVEVTTIDQRIENVVSEKAMSPITVETLARAFDMHSEALDAQSIATMVRTFWTALETVFLNPSTTNERDNVINSVCEIIQKTYLLKVTRLIYSQINNAITTENLRNVGIKSYSDFIEYFVTYEADSEEMKLIYALLNENILLRSRLYNLRKTLSDGSHISKYLEQHEKRIRWQLKRVYRTRNILTHIGYETTGIETIVNHLHSYFDYVINYILCKSENGDYIISMSSLIMETKMDNQIHYELLKSNKKLSLDSYQQYLFGPDNNLQFYNFEF